MERDSFNENFEQFLRDHANSLRMRAKDKVWDKIAAEMNKRRRRVHMTLAFFFFLTAGLGYYFISTSIKPLPTPTANNQSEIIIQEKTTANTAQINKAEKDLFVDAKPARKVHESFSPINNSITNEERRNLVETPIQTETSKSIEPVESTVAGSEEIIAEIQTATTEAETISTEVANNEKVEETATSEQVITATEDQPLQTIESVTNSYNPIKISTSKISWQFAFSPTISYRKLGENRSYMRDVSMQNAPSTLAPLYNVNNAVMHKPDIGFEVGVAAKYAVTKGIKVVGGLQFNVNRYDIKAFAAPYSVATIRLNNGSRLDSVNTVSNYSNTKGYSTDWLQNFYFQISTPIGVEVRLRGDEKMSFGFATSFQPTYLIGERAYIITSDYKSYAQVPWLTRRWNVNTNLQTFVSYSMGKTKWQVGPQVRYQLLSSFISEYPVKENLFDFGMRVGISLNNK